MRRKTPALAALLAIACALTISAPAGAAQSCTNSWGSDGHSGPWYVGQTQSLHGNTLVITCPSGGTAWSVTYQVCKSSGTTCDFTPINETRSGSGSTSFSISTNPVGCNTGWNYWTHVHNIVTSGDISKPTNHVHTIC